MRCLSKIALLLKTQAHIPLYPTKTFNLNTLNNINKNKAKIKNKNLNRAKISKKKIMALVQLCFKNLVSSQIQIGELIKSFFFAFIF